MPNKPSLPVEIFRISLGEILIVLVTAGDCTLVLVFCEN